jgi:two-component system response regulator
MIPEQVVLLVEDNGDDVELMRLAFEKNGIHCRFVVARDGRDAVDYFEGRGDHAARDPSAMPKLVLLDLNLPKIDGLEVLRRLRAKESTRLLPVIVLSSSKQDDDVRKSYELGANSYVRKPVDFQEFVDATRLLATYWLKLNEVSAGGGGT